MPKARPQFRVKVMVAHTVHPHIGKIEAAKKAIEPKASEWSATTAPDPSMLPPATARGVLTDTSGSMTATTGVVPPPADQNGAKGVTAATGGSGVYAAAEADSPNASRSAVTNEFPHSAGRATAAVAKSESPAESENSAPKSESSAAKSETATVMAEPREGSAKPNDANTTGLAKSETPVSGSEGQVAKSENSVAKSETATAMVEPAEGSSKADGAKTATGLAKSESPAPGGENSPAKSETSTVMVEPGDGSSKTNDANAAPLSGAVPAGSHETDSEKSTVNGEGTSAVPEPANQANNHPQSDALIAVANVDPAATPQPSVAGVKASESRISLAPEVRDELLNVGRRVESFAFPIEIGKRVPEDINLSVVPAPVVERVPALNGQFFFVVGDRVVFADPRTRQIVEIIGPNG
jgi:hypothetical protein